MQHLKFCRPVFKKALCRLALCCALITPTLSICMPSIPGLTVSTQNLEANTFVFPVMAPRLSSSYGTRVHPVRKLVRHHNGVDLAVPENTHVRVIAAGRVLFADEYAGYGKLVTVQHHGGYVSLYGHLSEIRANPGEKVKAGEIVGRVGSTGLASGPHLHFELRKNGEPLDPLKVFPDLTSSASG